MPQSAKGCERVPAKECQRVMKSAKGCQTEILRLPFPLPLPFWSPTTKTLGLRACVWGQAVGCLRCLLFWLPFWGGGEVLLVWGLFMYFRLGRFMGCLVRLCWFLVLLRVGLHRYRILCWWLSLRPLCGACWHGVCVHVLVEICMNGGAPWFSVNGFQFY